MTPELTLTLQLVLLAVQAVLGVHAALSARRAASFDITRDFDALAVAVSKLQQAARSVHMSRVRGAALEPKPEPVAQPLSQAKLTHQELRALARARLNGVTQ